MTKELDTRIEEAADLIRQAQTMVAFSGAGISTESGLADFRSPGGIWERYRTITYQEFLASEKARTEYWQMRRELIPGLLAARPNKAHLALAQLQQMKKLRAIITQNVDGLHQAAGSDQVIELHGTNRTVSCLSCGQRWSIEEIQTRLEADEAVPDCIDCGGIIKPDTVSFGQSMPEEAMSTAFQWAQDCDLMLMIGSSLAVQPAALVPVAAAEAGAKLIFINRTETPYDDLAAVRFNESAGELLTNLVEKIIGPG